MPDALFNIFWKQSRLLVFSYWIQFSIFDTKPRSSRKRFYGKCLFIIWKFEIIFDLR